MSSLRCGRYELNLSRPLIMGIVNLTPDSFSDGGLISSSSDAVRYVYQLIEEGADIVDIGGESTRPGATPVFVDEELRRVMPVLEQLKDCPVPISVDTYKPEVMRQAITAGASMINDINALLAPGALESVKESQAAVCIMHKQGEPQTMQLSPYYQDVVAEVSEFLQDRLHALNQAGIESERIVIDPGIGFGKTVEHNLALLRNLEMFTQFGVPLMLGISRKSVLGKISGSDIKDRVYASIAAALIAVSKKTKILRVHDVRATYEALAIWRTIEEEK